MASARSASGGRLAAAFGGRGGRHCHL